MEECSERQHKLSAVCKYPISSVTVLNWSRYTLTIPIGSPEILVKRYYCNRATSHVRGSAGKSSYNKTLILSFLVICDTDIKFP